MPINNCSLGHKVYQTSKTNRTLLQRNLGLLPPTNTISDQLYANIPLCNIVSDLTNEHIKTITVKKIYSVSGKTNKVLVYKSIDHSISAILKLERETNTTTPKNVPVYDQLQIGSCTANAGCSLLLYHNIIPSFLPSRLYYYYCARNIMNTVNYDSGATMAISCTVLMGITVGEKTQNGICRENMWPYPNPGNFNVISVITSPPNGTTITQCNTDAIDNGARGVNPNGVVAIVNNFTNLYNCLHNIGPFMFGFNVYTSFQNLTKNEYTYNPKTNIESFLGGHAVICVGYCASKKLFICQNSWGTSWGYNGFFCMPVSIMNSNKIVSGIYTIYSVTLD